MEKEPHLKSLYPCRMAKIILVVEDTTDLLTSIVEVLHMEGYEVSHASNGREALSQLSILNPDLIITDLMMPEMNGFDFIGQVRENAKWKGILILVYSALPKNENEKKVLDLGADAYLKKPSTLEALVELVHQLTQGSSL